MKQPSIYIVSDLSGIEDSLLLIELIADGYLRANPKDLEFWHFDNFIKLVETLDRQNKIDQSIDIFDGKESFLIYQKKQEK